jgi:hypothetical protein
MKMHKDKNDHELMIHASEVTAQLMDVIQDEQSKLGLTDADVANRCGLHRATVGRAKREGDLKLTNFVAMSAALGLSVTFKGKENTVHSAPEKMVHRGLSHFRTNGDEKYSDVKREKAFADAWEKENQGDISRGPMLRYLIPGFSQDQATAAATVMQWLGSEIGFSFLQETLKKANYEINATKESRK